MSHFTDALEILIKRRELKPAHAAAKMGIFPGVLGNLIKGDRNPSHESVKLILTHLTTTPRERAEIIRAYLLDELVRLNAVGTVAISLINDGDTGRMQALIDAASQFTDLADHLEQLTNLASRYGTSAIIASGITKLPNQLKSEPIPYSKNEDTHPSLVAEDPPAKPPKKPVSKK